MFWTANKKQVANENFFCVDYIAVVWWCTVKFKLNTLFEYLRSQNVIWYSRLIAFSDIKISFGLMRKIVNIKLMNFTWRNKIVKYSKEKNKWNSIKPWQHRDITRKIKGICVIYRNWGISYCLFCFFIEFAELTYKMVNLKNILICAIVEEENRNIFLLRKR